MSNTDIRRGDGYGVAQLKGAYDESLERELNKLTQQVERGQAVQADEHPALIACRKAADMVRGVHERHASEGETLAMHIEKIGETFHEMCKEAANQIRSQRVLPQEMANKMADELVEMGRMEAERQGRVSRGLTAARDALLGIDEQKQQ